MKNSFITFCRMVKIEHSFFALPFAYSGMFIASRGMPNLTQFLIFTIAMVAIRSFAMTANRIFDLPFDAINPRTQQRPLVSGEMSLKTAWVYLCCSALIFLIASWFLNELCFFLAIPTLFLAAGYSLLKRYTWLCHFCLGSILGLAPIAGYISVTGEFAFSPFLLFWGIVFWVSGFDILYSLQDQEFDKAHKLHSVPAAFGTEQSLLIARFCHVNTSIFFLLLGGSAQLHPQWYVFWLIISAALFYEHSLIKKDDLSKVDMAFFTVNSWIAVFFFIGVVCSLLW